MSAAPGQRSGVDVPLMAAHAEVKMQAPTTPFAVHDGGGVQHSSEAGPGQKPGVDM